MIMDVVSVSQFPFSLPVPQISGPRLPAAVPLRGVRRPGARNSIYTSFFCTASHHCPQPTDGGVSFVVPSESARLSHVVYQVPLRQHTRIRARALAHTHICTLHTYFHVRILNPRSS